MFFVKTCPYNKIGCVLDIYLNIVRKGSPDLNWTCIWYTVFDILLYPAFELQWYLFMDLRKAYNAMDRDTCLNILHDMGVNKKTIWLIARLWKESRICCRATGFYGRLFKARRGVTQGGLS